MTISILGDLNLSQLLISPTIRANLKLDYVFCPASNMSTFTQYRTLLPLGTHYMIVGSLGSLLVERFMIEFSTSLTSILDAHPNLRAVVIRPLPRPGSAIERSGLPTLEVSFPISFSLALTLPHFSLPLFSFLAFPPRIKH